MKYTLMAFLLLGLPFAALAEIEKESTFINSKNNSSQKSDFNLNKNDQLIQKLHKEGAISTQEAEKYINKNIELINNRINESKEFNKTIDSKNKSMQIIFNESENTFNLQLPKIDQLYKPEVVKVKNGWQISLNLSSGKDIDLSSFNYNSKYFSNINLKKIDGRIYLITIKRNNKYNLKRPILRFNDNNKLDILFKAVRKRNRKTPYESNLFNSDSNENNHEEAVAPPLGNIAVGSVILKNRGFIKLVGPNVSLTLNNAPARQALLKLARVGGYGFVLANDIKDSKTRNIPSSSNSNTLDLGPKVTLSFTNEDYSMAFNSILLASGLQAKRSDNLIIVGRNVLGKSFGPQLSKVYRLNQSSASSAADYLASLGASITKVDTLSVSTNSSSSNSSSGVDSSYKFIENYSASNGPLQGLIGTTDTRLQTITLVGSSELIKIAEKYLKQLDLRQRQVALSVKILDVEITDGEDMSNDWAYRTGNTFIVNANGVLESAFGTFLPPSAPTEPDILPNPGLLYPANELYNYLRARIKSSSTKVLANPTLILNESAEKIEGGQEILAKGGADKGQASIGRPFANESFLTLGTNVITGYKVKSGKDEPMTCEASFSTAGLTFGARVNKIDDNGYVTFSLSPKLTSVSELLDIPNCGPVNILNVRRLDTGTVRVRDSQTLILTGVVSDLDAKLATKIPLLGDLPILGRAFRSSSSNKRKSELIIMVTPKIIDDRISNTAGVGYVPSNKDSEIMIENSKN